MRLPVKIALPIAALCAATAASRSAQSGRSACWPSCRAAVGRPVARRRSPRSICLGDVAQLVQLRHASSQCSRFVVEHAANKVTVQYTCRGNGYGRTSIRKETNTLVQIESQGIAGGLPFQFKAEARRTGACK